MAVSTRQALLQALSAAGGSYVSGQQLAETLGVSRAAVHKAAAALTAQGYALEAAPRRGYRLAGGDPFCAEAIGDYPAPIYLYDTLESSNRTAKLLALDGAPHGTLVLTAHQSAGRGRLGRRFESPAGKGVYCSVLLRPEMPAANAQTAAAVFQLFPFAGHSTRIPPSTGVYTGTRKLCLAQCSACRPMRFRLPP